MAKFKFSDIEMAFAFVGSARHGANSALLCRDSGKILYQSDMAGMDEIEEEGDLDWEQCVEIPHKNDLDLGRDLVFEFVDEHLPDDSEAVRGMFHRSGAYGKYKALLEKRGLLQEWYKEEEDREACALRKWCAANGIELEG